MQDNSDKQNAKFLGEFFEKEEKDPLYMLIKQAANLPDEAMGSERDIRARESARRHVREHEAEVKYFMGLEDGGIADIETPPIDN